MASPSGPANRSGPVAPMVLVVCTAVVVIECARALFSLTYKVGESIGFLVAGLVVVALFASPVVAPLLRRLVPPRALLLGAVGLLAAGRLVVQVMAWPTFVDRVRRSAQWAPGGIWKRCCSGSSAYS